MADRPSHALFAGFRVTSLGTLASRVLGLVRDVATASLLGLSGDGVMDAFVVAFRIPNLFRRLFGEGALAASYLPILARRLERDPAAAWQMASVTLVWLGVVLAALVLVGEGACAVLWWQFGDVPGDRLVLGLSAVLLPYLFFICLAAQVTATLHAVAHFSVPALAPTLLNLCWLAAVWFIAPSVSDDKQVQTYVLAVSVLAAGVLQLVVQFPALRRHGFRFDYNWQAAREGLVELASSFGPVVLGLMVTQINTFLDSLMAWGFAAPPQGPRTIAWLGHAVRYPLEQGAAAAIYYGERLYQFPLGLLGVAAATVLFPALSRHAARGQRGRLGADLSAGLRLVLFLGVPAGAGLVLLSEPIARLFFQHGEFTSADTARVARIIVCYGLGVWAFCALPLLVRAYYAVGDRATPVRIGAVAMLMNLALDVMLVWPWAEAGLAAATSLSAVAQLGLLLALFHQRWASLDWTPLFRTTAISLTATGCMLAAGYAALRLVSGGAAAVAEDVSLPAEAACVVVPLAAGVLVFLAVSRFLGASELAILWERSGAVPLER